MVLTLEYFQALRACALVVAVCISTGGSVNSADQQTFSHPLTFVVSLALPCLLLPTIVSHAPPLNLCLHIRIDLACPLA